MTLPTPAPRAPLAIVPRAKALPLREAWEVYTSCSRSSMHSRLASIWKCQLADLAELDVTQLTARQLTLWEAKHISLGYAPKSTYDAFYTLAAAVRASLGDSEELPWRIGRGKYWKPRRAPVPRREPPACGTVEEAELLIHAALEDDRARRGGAHGAAYARRLWDLGPRCAIALFIGARNGELAGLGWDDLALEGGKPQVRICHQAIDQWRKHHPAWSRPLTLPKGEKERRLLLHPTAVVALHHQRELLEERAWYRQDGPVFPSPESSPFAGGWRNNANAIKPEKMKELARAAGLPFADEWVTHSLRHSLATLESTSGADLRSIQRRTGHGTLRVLEGYIHARTGRALAPTAIPQLALSFDTSEHDTDKSLTTVPESEEP